MPVDTGMPGLDGFHTGKSAKSRSYSNPALHKLDIGMSATWASGLAEAIAALEPSQTRLHSRQQVFTPDHKARIMANRKAPAHSTPTGTTYTSGRGLISREAQLMSLPHSLYTYTAHIAPYTQILPGSKVRPGPHNLAPMTGLAAHKPQGTWGTTGSGLGGTQQPGGSPHRPPRAYGTVQVATQGSTHHSEPVLKEVSRMPTATTMSSHVMVGALVSPTHSHSTTSTSHSTLLTSTLPPRSPPRASTHATKPYPSQSLSSTSSGPHRSLSLLSPTTSQEAGVSLTSSLSADQPTASPPPHTPQQHHHHHHHHHLAAQPPTSPSQGATQPHLSVQTLPAPLDPETSLASIRPPTHQASSPHAVPQHSTTTATAHPAKYPAFMTSSGPQARPLPVANSPVLRQRKAGSAGGVATVMQQVLAKAPDLAAAVVQANDRVTAANLAALGAGLSEPHPAGSLLSALIPSQMPTIAPGVGLTGHIAARQAQLYQQMLQQDSQEGAAHLHAQPSGAVGNAMSSPRAVPIGDRAPEGLQQVAAFSSDAAGVMLTALAMQEQTGALYGSGPAQAAQPALSQSGLVCPASTPSQQQAETGGAATAAGTAPQATNQRLPVRHVLPSRGQEAMQAEAQKAVARATLGHELNSLVDAMHAEMSACVDDTDLVLKTRFTHHKRGPLPNLHPPALAIDSPNTASPQADAADAERIQAATPATPMQQDAAAAIANQPTSTTTSTQLGASIRTPMFERRASITTGIPATALQGAPRQGIMSPSPATEHAAALSQPAISDCKTAELEPRLPPHIAVDITDVDAAATKRLQEAEAAALAAAEAAAAAAAQVPAQPAKPAGRQGLAEAVAAAGAALVNAAAQLLSPKPSVQPPTAPATALAQADAAQATTTTTPREPQSQPPDPAAPDANQAAKPAPLLLKTSQSFTASSGSPSSPTLVINELLEQLVDDIPERPQWSGWQAQYRETQKSTASDAASAQGPPATAVATPTPEQPAETEAPADRAVSRSEGPSSALQGALEEDAGSCPPVAVGTDAAGGPADSEQTAESKHPGEGQGHAAPSETEATPSPAADTAADSSSLGPQAVSAPIQSRLLSPSCADPATAAEASVPAPAPPASSAAVDTGPETEANAVGVADVASQPPAVAASVDNQPQQDSSMQQPDTEGGGAVVAQREPSQRERPAVAEDHSRDVYSPNASMKGVSVAEQAQALMKMKHRSDAGAPLPGVYMRNSAGAASGPSSYYPDDDDDLDLDDTYSNQEYGSATQSSSGAGGHRRWTISTEGYEATGEGDDEAVEEGMAEGAADTEDGEMLSVSAFGITPVQPLQHSLGRKSPTDAPTPTKGFSANDVVEGGVRLLGQKYEVLDVVGEGAYGMVMKCRVRDSDPDRWVAVKEFKINDDDPDAEDVKRTSRREVALLRALQHPHVVACLDDFLVRDRLFIVMEFVPCNLLELLEAQPGGMDREAVRLILYQLCTAIAFIHSKNVIYRDIKPENLLVDEQGRLKLCDFGFARFYTAAPEEKLTDYVATRWYRAPELLLGPPFQDKDSTTVQSMYGPPVDMWAIGCLMGELMDGEPLFPGDSDLDQLYRIQAMLGAVTAEQQALFNRNPMNQGIAFNIKDPMTLSNRYEGTMNPVELDFMNGLLCMDPQKRLTGEACLRHPYLRDLYEADVAKGVYTGASILQQVQGATSQQPDAALQSADTTAEGQDGGRD